VRESRGKKVERVLNILAILKGEYPHSKTALNFRDAFQCLIATILSAQCTDVQVNKVTPGLFRKYPDPKAFCQANLEKLEGEIRSTGFYKNKAKSIQNCSCEIVEKYDGRVPADLDTLVTLSGVGRKTANCVIGNAYGQPALTVDTHVKRLSRRMGMTREKNPDKIETVLKALWPSEAWLLGSHLLIDHGRAVCKARKPKCSQCVVAEYCPKIEVKNAG